MQSQAFWTLLLAGAIGLGADQPGAQPGPMVSSQPQLGKLAEEKQERLLADLQSSCQKLLKLQTAVYEGTKDLNRVIEAAGKKPRSEDQQAALKLANLEKDIIVKTSRIIAKLEAEGTAVAFPEVFQQLRADMKLVQRRLEECDVGAATQDLEKDILDTLQEMLQALKK